MKLNVLCGICVCVCLCANGVLAANKLIVVLVDGVRWDYINDSELKGIHQIIKNGVRAPTVTPIFPSLSYPNWYSIVTGLYAENHGFVSNNMYDPEIDNTFWMMPKPGTTDVRWWNDAEPLWITAQKNDRRSALYWWGGCEVEIRGEHPTICERYLDNGHPRPERGIDFLQRIDDIVELFKPSRNYPVDRLSLALLYYEPVDYTGHHSGPDTADRVNALRDIDSLLEQMQSKIKKAGLDKEVNLMVVSDHGMTDVTEKAVKYISLEKYAPMVNQQLERGGLSWIFPKPGMLDKLVEEMEGDKIEGLYVYKKENIPEKYHIKNHRRIAPVLLVAKKNYFITKIGNPDNKMDPPLYGHHGYDPEEVNDMKTIFFATGPAFKKGFQTQDLNITDLYNVMCSVLRIPPLPNNGSWERVQSMFVEKDNRLAYVEPTSSSAERIGGKWLSLYIATLLAAYSVAVSLMKQQ